MQQLLTAQKESDKKKMEKKNKEKEKYLAGKIGKIYGVISSSLSEFRPTPITGYQSASRVQACAPVL